MTIPEDVVVVTGGGSGIGRAVAEACLRQGAQVVVVGRTAAKLAAVKGAFAVVADMTREDDAFRAATETEAKYGRVNVLVNAAGSAESAAFSKTDVVLWERMMAVNATSVFLACRAFIGALTATRGSIVTVASIAGKLGAPYIAAYAASKHAALGLTRALAAEYAGKGVRVNAVCPGYVDTPMTDRTVENIVARTGRDAKSVREQLGRMNAAKRLLTPAEVAAAVLQLASRDCSVTGQTIDL